MANSWDDLMKMLVRSHPQDFVSFISQGALFQGDITNELKVRSIEADSSAKQYAMMKKSSFTWNFNVTATIQCDGVCGNIIALQII